LIAFIQNHNPMKTIAFAVLFLAGINSFAQIISIQKLPDGTEPVMDGNVDAVWSMADTMLIESDFAGELPSIGKAFWQALWNDEAIFIKVEVEDDFHCDEWCSGDEQWMSDRVEVYFDVNKILKDGLGPSINNSGHYQIAPDWKQGINQTSWEEVDYRGLKYNVGYQISDTGYLYEFKIYNSNFLDKNGILISPYVVDSMGFDVYVVDRDSANDNRRRLVWKNQGDISENWYNSDDAGVVNFHYNSQEPLLVVSSPLRDFIDYGAIHNMPDINVDSLNNDTLILINRGEEELIITSIKLTGDGFSFIPPADSTLSRNEIQELYIHFTGDKDSTYFAEMEIISNNDAYDTLVFQFKQNCFDSYFNERTDFIFNIEKLKTPERFQFKGK